MVGGSSNHPIYHLNQTKKVRIEMVRIKEITSGRALSKTFKELFKCFTKVFSVQSNRDAFKPHEEAGDFKKWKHCSNSSAPQFDINPVTERTWLQRDETTKLGKPKCARKSRSLRVFVMVEPKSNHTCEGRGLKIFICSVI